jgi:hypothetical protein
MYDCLTIILGCPNRYFIDGVEVPFAWIAEKNLGQNKTLILWK